MKTLILFFLTLPLAVISYAQNQFCTTSDIHKSKLLSDSAYRTGVEEIEDEITAILNNRGTRNTDILVIPIVVHVIHLGEAIGTGSNIPDHQIYEAINGLNSRYRRYVGSGVDTEIEFCLATRDPNGNPTTGINRVDGSGVPNYATDGIEGSVPGGADANTVKALSIWPHLNYYNIWVVNNIYGNTAGYANYPNSDPYEGAVIEKAYMTYNYETLSHELGHGLYLYHTFEGDGNGCPANLICQSSGDRVCDTPPHTNTDCGSTNPCSISGVWDNSRYNIMSYCYPDYEEGRFTEGQKTRMRATMLTSPRSQLLNSKGCIPVDFYTRITKVDNLCNGECNGSITVNPIYPSSYSYLWNTGETEETISGLCAGNYSVTITDTNNLSYTTTITISQPEELIVTTSETPSCDNSATGTATITATGGSVISTEYLIEDWEQPNTTWVIANGTQVNKWKIGSAISNGGNNSVYISNDDSLNWYSVSYYPSVVHFYKDVIFPAGSSSKLLFDLKCNGEYNYDYLTVSLAPTSYVPVAGTVPNTSYRIGATQYLYQMPFETNTIEINSIYAGTTRRLIFSWSNDFTAGGLPPAAIDNIIISHSSTTGYTYAWNTNPVGINSVINSLVPGSYSYSVSDANDCSSFGSVIIENSQQPPTPVISQNGTILSCSTTGMSSYQWFANGNIVPACSTMTCSCGWDVNYTVIITDSSGCSSESEVFNATNCTSAIDEVDKTDLNLYPNPNLGLFTLAGKVRNTKNVSLILFNTVGEIVYSEIIKSVGNSVYKTFNLANLAAGLYTLQIITETKTESRKLIVQKKN